MQFYFLSIVCNGLSGYILTQDQDTRETFDYPDAGPVSPLQNETFRLILGALAAAVGLLKLLSPVRGDLLIIGDLIPALLGFAAGFILLFDYYRDRSSLNTEQSDGFAQILAGKRKWIGYTALIAAALHFLFPQALFL